MAMDTLIQRLIDRLHERIFRVIPPEERHRKLALVNTLASKKSDETETAVGVAKALPFKVDSGFRRSRHRKTMKADTLRRAQSFPVEHQSDNSESPVLDFCPTPSVSTAGLLEEIEAHLPSTYSLANVYDHTPHTIGNIRTFARLSRVGTNLTPLEKSTEKVPEVEPFEANRSKSLQKEMFVQKTLIDQTVKAIKFCKARKVSESEDIESVRLYLLAKLRHDAIYLELQRLKLFHPMEENLGEIAISDLFFTLSDVQNYERGHFICVAIKNERLLASDIKTEVNNGRLHFPVDFRFNELNRDFAVYLELYRLNCGMKQKKETIKILGVKNLLKMATNKEDEAACEGKWFSCVGSATLKLDDVKRREAGKLIINFHGGFDPAFERRITVHLDVRVSHGAELSGFLNLFKNRCWHRWWCCHVDQCLLFWAYPEDQESGKVPLESIYLPSCLENVKPAGMDVCIRPHAFMILSEDGSNKILLTAGSQRDMMKWVNHLQTTIQQYQAWIPKF